MRLSASEKYEIIQMVDQSDMGVNKTLKEIGVNKSTFFNWYKAYCDKGIDGLKPHQRASNRQQWRSTPYLKEPGCGSCVGLPASFTQRTGSQDD